jgi:hypothetical protein
LFSLTSPPPPSQPPPLASLLVLFVANTAPVPPDNSTSQGVTIAVALLPLFLLLRQGSGAELPSPFDDNAAIILAGFVLSIILPPLTPSLPAQCPSSSGGRNGGMSVLRTFTPLIPGRGENLRYFVHSACIQLRATPATAYCTRRRIGSCLEGRVK